MFCYENVPDSFVDCVYNKFMGDYPNFVRPYVSYIENVAITLLAEGMDPKTEDPLHFLIEKNFSLNEKIMNNYENEDVYFDEVMMSLNEGVASPKGERLLKEGINWLNYFDEDSIKRLIKVLLEDECFQIYSEWYVISCLVENGYTSHAEEEYIDSDLYNVGVFYEDFDKVEIVGVARNNPKLNGSLCKLDENGYLLNSEGTNIWFHASGDYDLTELTKDGTLRSSVSNYGQVEWSRFWFTESLERAEYFLEHTFIYEIKVKPTKIFCYENVPNEFVNCVYNKLMGAAPDFVRPYVSYVEQVAITLLAEGLNPKVDNFVDYLDFISVRNKMGADYAMDYQIRVLDRIEGKSVSEKGKEFLKEGGNWLDYFDETSIKKLIKELLEAGQFVIYAEWYVISCLIENGYTAHMEEELLYHDDNNAAVFYQDFDKVEIVGVARNNPITLTERHEYEVPMQFFNFYNDDGKLVGEGDYEIINSFEDMRLRWGHAPHESELTALKNAINGQFPVGVLVDIKISRLHRGKGYGQQITRETVEHMINSEGAKTILVIVEIHPEEPYDLLPWYEMQGFEDLGIKTRWGYPLMILR
jgi:ribosomal protein S18 acetylase RimI-like enzyme